MAKVLVIAAHPDDEMLGCAGTMAKHSAQGDEVHILIMAEGATSRSLVRDREAHEEELSELSMAAYKAAKTVGAASVRLHNFADNRMDGENLLDVVKVVEEKIEKNRPSIIYTHHPSCLNVDHQVTHKAVVTACRALPDSGIETLLFFEIPSSSEWQVPTGGITFAPNWFVDISDTLDKKLAALTDYQSEMREFPHPRSLKAVEHLARWRGASSGFAAAEAFVLGRRCQK